MSHFCSRLEHLNLPLNAPLHHLSKSVVTIVICYTNNLHSKSIIYHNYRLHYFTIQNDCLLKFCINFSFRVHRIKIFTIRANIKL